MTVKRLLHIQTKFSGDYPLFDNFVLSLDRNRFENTVCFLRGMPDNKTRLEREGIDTVYLGKNSNTERRIRLKKIFMLKDVVKRKQIDLIHSHRHKPTVYAVLASVLSGGVPVVSTVHGKGRTRSRKRWFVNKFLLKNVNRIVAVSNAVRDDIMLTNNWLSPEKVVTVHNGLDYKRILQASGIPNNEIRKKILPGHESTFWYGTVGRLKPVKNQQRLIQAFAKVCEQKSDCLLLIAGDGPLKQELRALVSDLKLDDKIFLLGYRTDIPEILGALDVFILPSLSEGLVLSMLEAMASGLPVIASHIDASEEIMDGQECGLLMDPFNVDDICEKVLMIRDFDEADRLRMGDRARARATETFTVERMTREMAGIYDELLL